MADKRVLSRLPQPRSGLPKPNAGPVSRLATTRVTRRSVSVPDLSKVGTKPAAGSLYGATRSNLQSNLAGARKPTTGTRPAVTSTLTANRKRTAAAANGPSAAGHGGKRPLVPSDSNKQNARSVASDKQAPSAGKRKVAAWDTKGQLEIANTKIEQLRQEKENLEDAAEQAISLREQLRNCEDKLKQSEAELIAARKKIKENESLSSVNAELQKDVQTLSTKVKEYSDRTEQLLSDLANVRKLLEEANCKILVLTEENGREKTQNELLLRQIQDLEIKQKSFLDEIYQLQLLRRTMHNQILDLKGNIRVFCRVRPPLAPELDRPLCSITFPNEASLEVKSAAAPTAATPYSTNKNKTDKYSFTYDKVFPPNAGQEEIYEELSQLVQSALDGYNVCIFAYGQTGSGKTYTMEGSDEPQSRGMIPRAVETIFKSLEEQSKLGWEYTIKVSFLEIYNEVIRDLLDLNSDAPHEVKMVDANSDDITVSNLTTEVVTDAPGLYNLLKVAQKNRFVAATVCNDYSSRSHSITQIKLEGVNSSRAAKCKGTLNLIDLAGSEKYRDENKDDRKVETVNINKSLASLSLVVLKLAEKSDHIPFRDSKLTHLLMPSLKGNSKTLMMVNVSPFDDCYNESMSSLRFASRVSKVKVDSKRQVKSTLGSSSSFKAPK